MTPEEIETPAAPEFVTGKDGSEIRIGDRIAYAVMNYRSAILRVGTVKDIYIQKGRSVPKLRITPDSGLYKHSEPRDSFIYAVNATGDFVKLS